MEKAPVFVKIEEYKDVMDIMALLREKIGQAKYLLDKIAQMKAQEDAELANWAKAIDEVDARITSVDKTLFEPNI